MATIPTLTERDIRSLVGEQNLLNGQRYVREGALFDTRRQGRTLTASCKGTHGETYREQVTFNDTGIEDSFCTCPASNTGYCKHIAALLWAWLQKPRDFTEMEQVEAGLEKLSKAQLISLMRQMVQLHPDLGGLIEKIRPTAKKQQERVPFNPELYRRQISEIFYHTDRNQWGSEGRAAEPLLRIKAIADEYAEQEDYADATALYEMIVRAIIDEYHSFRWHADEGDLDDVVEECVEGLGDCLAEEHDDPAVRKQIIQTLYAVFDFDLSLENDEPVMSSEVPKLLVRYTTSEERQVVAGWVREGFDLDVDWYIEDVSEDFYGPIKLLLGLEADTIDDETFLRICRETESYDYLIERLLKLGRVDEAIQEAENVEDYEILDIADILVEHGYGDAAEKLIEERAKDSRDTDILEWLKDRYQDRGDIAKALEMATRIFRAYPVSATLDGYREIRQFAQQLSRWDIVQIELLDFLDKEQNIPLLIRIALDEGLVEKALALLESQKRPEGSREGPYGYGNYEVAIDVARAAEETHPQASIEIYQRYVKRLIDLRGRENYHIACQYLLSVRRLYQKLGKDDVWTNYIMELREQNRNLPALKDEMAKVKL